MSDKSFTPVILCGGSGSRLWPLSRKSYPKQFLNLTVDNNYSLLQETYKRLEGLEDINPPILICNENHRFIIAEQFREINIKPQSILLEPFGKNTAPAIALASIKAIESGKDPLLLVLSSDHQINNKDLFKKVIRNGLNYAEQGRIVVFGVSPNYPETGYGYIKTKKTNTSSSLEGYEIDKFIEKPSLDKARIYLKDNKYLWNSGIFLFKASVILNEINKFNPEIITQCYEALKKKKTDLDFQRIDKEIFKKCPDISLDISVMEKTDLGTVLLMNAGWSDLGNWNALWKNSIKDLNGNSYKGKVHLRNTKNCFIRSEGRLIVGLGIENIIAVETSDALLISDQSHSQKVREIVSDLKNKNFIEGEEHKRIHRPWGEYETIIERKYWKVKKIIVRPHQSLSLQKHDFRSEHWIVVGGKAKVQIGSEIFELSKNQSTFVPQKVKHKLSNEKDQPLIIIEVQSGTYVGEDDIVRFDDIYGRIKDN